MRCVKTETHSDVMVLAVGPGLGDWLSSRWLQSAWRRPGGPEQRQSSPRQLVRLAGAGLTLETVNHRTNQLRQVMCMGLVLSMCFSSWL